MRTACLATVQEKYHYILAGHVCLRPLQQPSYHYVHTPYRSLRDSFLFHGRTSKTEHLKLKYGSILPILVIPKHLTVYPPIWFLINVVIRKLYQRSPPSSLLYTTWIHWQRTTLFVFPPLDKMQPTDPFLPFFLNFTRRHNALDFSNPTNARVLQAKMAILPPGPNRIHQVIKGRSSNPSPYFWLSSMYHITSSEGGKEPNIPVWHGQYLRLTPIGKRNGLNHFKGGSTLGAPLCLTLSNQRTCQYHGVLPDIFSYCYTFRPFCLFIHLVVYSFFVTHRNPSSGTLSRLPFRPLFQTV